MSRFSSLSRYLKRLSGQSRTRSNRPSSRLTVEALEDRTVPTAVAPPSGLVSWWTADNTPADLMGLNDATLTNVSYATGAVGQAFNFNGSNGWAALGDPASLAFTTSMTIEGWIKVNGLPTSYNFGTILFRGDNRGGLDPYTLVVLPNGDLRFNINGYPTGNATIEAPVPIGQFVHVAATLDDATGLMTLYVNGAVVGQTTTTVRPFGALDPMQQPGVGIGNSNALSSYNVPFDGLIDELSVYNRALTAAEIQGIYNAGSDGKIKRIIVDDGDSGFSATAGWVTGWAGQGYQNDVSFAEAGDGTQVATWTFTGLTSGYYRVSATWSEDANRATNAPYTILDGTTALGTVRVNQERAPHHFTDSGRPWFNLGGVYSPTSGTLVVRLTNDANEYVIADAVRIEQVTMGPQVIDDGGAGFLATDGFVSFSGQGHGGDVTFAAPGTGEHVALWTFTVTPGVYRISATWSEHENRATNAPFHIYDGGSFLSEVRVNQEVAPNDFQEGGTWWEDLGDGVYQITGTELTVYLLDDANDYVIADAVRIERLGA